MSVVDLITVNKPAGDAAALRDRFVWPAVLDASAVIDDLLYQTGARRATSALRLSMMLGVLRPVGKLDLLDEVGRRLPEIAAVEGRDLDQMRHMLATEYTPVLRLVNVTGLSFDHAGLRAVVREAPDDAPSAVLNLLLDPALLLTTDNDLLRNGFGVWREQGAPVKWSFAAATARDAAAPLAVSTMAYPAALVVQLLVSLASDAARKRPLVATSAAAAAALAVIAAVGSPRWTSEWRPSIAALIRDALAAVGRFVEPYPDALRQLEEYRAARPGPGTVEANIARTIALAPSSGLLVSELKAIHPSAAGSVQSVLRAHPAFTRTDRWRWALGSTPRSGNDERYRA